MLCCYTINIPFILLCGNIVGDINYRRAGKLLAMIWTDKRDVKLISTLHNTSVAPTGQTDRQPELPVMKPQLILDYNNQMGGIDVSDMMSNRYAALRKTNKWYKKLAFHLSDLCITNAFVLHKPVTGKGTPHYDFVLSIAKELIENSIGETEDRPAPTRACRRSGPDAPSQLSQKGSEHWPEVIKPSANAKKQNPTKPYVVCTPAARRIAGEKRPRPESRYWCPECTVGLHPQCFKADHTRKVYK